MVKNLPANAGDTGSIPGSGSSPGEGNGNPLQYSSWRIPWTEEPGGLLSMVSQRVGHDFGTQLPNPWVEPASLVSPALAGGFFTTNATWQEYLSGLPLSSPVDLPDPGIEPVSPALAGEFFTTMPSGKPQGNNSKSQICFENSSLSSVFS